MMKKETLRRIFPFWSKASPAPPLNPGVKFSSTRLHPLDAKYDFEEHKSSHSDQDRLHRVAAALAELKGGALKSTPVDGIQLSLGIPPYFERELNSFPLDAIRRSPHFFSCYWAEGVKPFLLSALLVGDETPAPVETPPANFSEVSDAYLLSEMFGLADRHGYQVPSKARLREKAFANIIQHRPCVVCLQGAGGIGEMMEEDEYWALTMLWAGYQDAITMAAVQLHQEQGIPLPISSNPRS
ncbi:MAG: hypothetical protein QM758_06190 [Armatimonas sp.]